MSASHAIRHEALPIQALLENFLGRLVRMRVGIDNTQALTAIEKGYSKRLRHLSRTHRISIGVLNELQKDGEAMVEFVHEPTASHKGDLFTKSFAPAAFAERVQMLGMQECEQE